jgi:hypothetical protein
MQNKLPPFVNERLLICNFRKKPKKVPAQVARSAAWVGDPQRGPPTRGECHAARFRRCDQ